MTTHISTAGKITLPEDIRQQLGWTTDTEIELEVTGEVLQLRPKKQSSYGELLIEKLRGKGSVQISTDEIMALTRGE